MDPTTVTPAPPAAPTVDRGTGEPALLLVPGWCGDRSVFDPLLGPLARHRRVISTDLPGHGGHPRDVTDVSSAAVAEDLVRLLDHHGVERAVPVALSHAGWLAIDLADRLGTDRVPAIVLLDWMVLGTPPGFDQVLAALQGPGWEQVRGGLFDRWVDGLELPALHGYVASMGTYGRAHWARAGREIAAGFAQGAPLEVLARAPRPTLHLYSQPADEDYRAAQEGFAAGHPWFAVQRLGARSHFPMFEVPEEMAERVEEFVCRLT